MQSPNIPPLPETAPPPRKTTPIWVWAVAGGCGCVAFLFIIMAAILFPVFAQAREKARMASCMSNVKQTGLGALLYSQDWDEILPHSDRWMNQIFAYVHKDAPFHCPSVSVSNHDVYGYAYNSELSKKPLADIADPRTTSMIYDSSNLVRNASDLLTSLPSPPRHLGSNIMGFADGHAAKLGRGPSEPTSNP